MIKHYAYYFLLSIMAMFAADLVLDGYFRFVLYFIIGYAIPPYGEIYAWAVEMSLDDDKWLSRQIGARQ